MDPCSVLLGIVVIVFVVLGGVFLGIGLFEVLTTLFGGGD